MKYLFINSRIPSFALFVYIIFVIVFTQDSIASATADLIYKIENEEGPAPSFDDLGPAIYNIPGTTNAASSPWIYATEIAVAETLLPIYYRVLSA